MSNVLKMLSRGGAVAPTDEYFNQTTLLLHGDGTNGAQNNTFLDSSSNNFTITRNGNTTQGTFSPFSSEAGKWSNYFDGSGDYIHNTSVALIGSTVSTFTIQGWIYMTAAPTSDVNNISGFITVDGTAAGIINYLAFGPLSTRALCLRWFDGAAKIATGSTVLNLNEWYHIACAVNSNSIQFYVNGVAESMGGTTTLTNRNGTTNNFSIGQNYYGAISGYLANVSVTTTAVYTSAFTPSTTPLSTGTSGQVLLTCYSNRFVDANTATTAKTIIPVGNVAVQPFSPFAPSAAYSASVNGGSGYFDGTGDYLETPSSSDLAFGTGDFCVEFFIYRTVAGLDGLYSNSAGAGGGDAQFEIQVNASNKVILIGWLSTFMTSSASLSINEWNHVAVVRSGTSMAIFINGNREATATSANNFSSTNTFYIGAQRSSAANPVTGYLSDLRVVKARAVYDPTQTTITIPTAPLTATSGGDDPPQGTETSLLLSGTNAGIFDNTGKNNLETVGNAQIDTGTKKYGTGSMEFDGTGDKLVTPPSQNAVFGTGDFTIECWLYVASNPAQFTCIASNWAGADPSWNLNFSNGSGNIRFNNNASIFLISSSAITTGQFVHIAVARSGTSLKMFFDGVEVASATNSTSFGNASTGINIGMYYNNTYPLNGLVDDFRITKDVARYTTTFTPPTAPFPDL